MTSTADEQTANPHDQLAHLRATGPVHPVPIGPGKTGWLITGYADARRALTDPCLSKGALAGMSPFPVQVRAAMSEHMLNADPPDHTRLRRLVSAAFTARRIEGLRPRIQEITDGLLDALEAAADRTSGGSREHSPHADVIDDFAFPLPFQVICELVGVPDVDREAFRGWSNTMVAGPAAAPEDMFAAVSQCADYLADLIARKRAEPDDALLSGLIEASDAGDRLTGDELSSLVFLLLLAGHETTVNLIGNAVFLLLQRPELAARLRADESALPAAIEEFLRYESPVKASTLRLAVEPVTIGEAVIPAGDIAIISLLSANRDPEAFADADTFDPARADASGHLAFGHGIHYCLGAPLARLEGQIAIGSLLRRFPQMQPAGDLADLAWRPGLLMHGLVTLPVRLR